MTPVRDQGKCAACWAFTALETVESAYAIAGNDPVIMAPQQLIDCVPVFNGEGEKNGCGPNFSEFAYNFMKKVETMRETDYPYVSGKNPKKYNCRPLLGHQGVTKIFSYGYVSRNSQSIKMALKYAGPLSVTLSTENDAFNFYKTGIITAMDDCFGIEDHSAVIVGWGRNYQNLVEYYIVKNSFGADWGEQGYFRIEITEGAGTCGINRDVIFVRI